MRNASYACLAVSVADHAFSSNAFARRGLHVRRVFTSQDARAVLRDWSFDVLLIGAAAAGLRSVAPDVPVVTVPHALPAGTPGDETLASLLAEALAARARAQWQRSIEGGREARCGSLRIDRAHFTAWVEATPLPLAPADLRLLWLLMRRAGAAESELAYLRTVEVAAALADDWVAAADSALALRRSAHGAVARLRSALARAGARDLAIEARRGCGVQLCIAAEAAASHESHAPHQPTHEEIA
jgi:hypothetical protein